MAHITFAHPVIPPAVEVALGDAPEIPIGEAEPIPRLVIPRGAPARPRVSATPAPGPAATEKLADPLIAPELTDEQLATAKLATQQSLVIAERNLTLVRGKNLSPAQRDLVSKIQGFVDSTREAMKMNDWPRARNQARKAEVLSQEFSPNP